jgi:hypothetical protein
MHNERDRRFVARPLILDADIAESPLCGQRHCRGQPLREPEEREADSNTVNGSPPSAGSASMIVGMLWFGEKARNSCLTDRGAEVHGMNAVIEVCFLRNDVILWPFGVGQ